MDEPRGRIQRWHFLSFDFVNRCPTPHDTCKMHPSMIKGRSVGPCNLDLPDDKGMITKPRYYHTTSVGKTSWVGSEFVRDLRLILFFGFNATGTSEKKSLMQLAHRPFCMKRNNISSLVMSVIRRSCIFLSTPLCFRAKYRAITLKFLL